MLCTKMMFRRQYYSRLLAALALADFATLFRAYAADARFIISHSHLALCWLATVITLRWVDVEHIIAALDEMINIMSSKMRLLAYTGWDENDQLILT